MHWALRVFPRHKQTVRLHDAIDPFVIDGGQPFRAHLPVQDRRNPPVAIGRSGRHQRCDQRHQRRVLRPIYVVPTRLSPVVHPVNQVRAGHTQRFGHNLNWKSPLKGDRTSKICFFVTWTTPHAESRPPAFCGRAGVPVHGCDLQSVGRPCCWSRHHPLTRRHFLPPA